MAIPTRSICRTGSGGASAPGFPTRRSLRFTAELHGEQYLDDAVRFTGAQTQTFPIDSEQDGPVNASLGLTWQGRNGFFAGAAVNYGLRFDGRSQFGSFEDEGGDYGGFQFRLGYHPGVRVYVAPAPRPSSAAATGEQAAACVRAASPARWSRQVSTCLLMRSIRTRCLTYRWSAHPSAGTPSAFSRR